MFVQGFTAITRPLNDLLVGHVTNHKGKKVSHLKEGDSLMVTRAASKF